MGELTALKVKALKEPGRYADGDGLHLWIKGNGNRYWILRVQVHGVRRDFSVGPASTTTLAEARTRAIELRKQCRSGIDPVAAKKASRSQRPAVATFAQVAEQAHEALRGGWRNGKHQTQWLSTLRTYAFPTLGSVPIDKVEPSAIVDVLSPIWLTKPETASRVKQRIGTVLDYAFAKQLRASEAPMRAIGKGLPSQKKRDRHFAALPYIDVPTLLVKLNETNTVGRLALRFTILTAARSGEVRKAKWSEIDFQGKRWIVPADHMKAGREHVVPLSEPALHVLQLAKGDRTATPTEHVFPGNNGKPLSDMTLTKVLRAATSQPATVHGFRSSFRDWAAETQMQIPGDVVEASLAHVNPNRVEAAYRRTNYFDQRASLMDSWAAFLVP